MNDAFAEISLLPLNRSDSRDSDIVYMKYIKPHPINANVNEIVNEFRKKGIKQQQPIPKVVT